MTAEEVKALQAGDTVTIQKEGHEKRVEAEIELRRLEGELRDKVLETIS